MKWFIRIMLPALVLASCSKEGGSLVEAGSFSTGERTEIVSHEAMELGRRMKNPYSVANVGKALSSLYPTRASIDVPTTSLYVRFLPRTVEEYGLLEELGVEMLDHPLDREILVDGDYYHDPAIPEGDMTWQYAVVPADFDFPGDIRHEILESCFIPEEGMVTKGLEDVDWSAVERQSFRLTDNEDLLLPETRAKTKPSGRITIQDDKLVREVGVAGVKMVANVFVKVSTTYTDASGNYSFPAKFSARPRYSICFKNQLGFSIGLNLVLVPASVSTLGKNDPNGINVTVDRSSDATLFRRCAVNNAAYDYYQSCQATGVTAPPKNLRFWILNILRPSSTLMIHHGAFLDSKLVSNYLGVYKLLVQVVAPDITIGSKGKNGDYAELYSCTIHEMAHASHFVKAGTTFWNTFATYVLTSFLTTGSSYGTGNADNAGYCEVGEMWAYYIENMLYKDRYGVNPGRGTEYWFHPEILWTLEEGGVSRSDICLALKSGVTDVDAFKDELVTCCPSKKTLINQTFKKYSK